ncbi:MAG: hypothetical protein J5I92_01010 [Thiogranum sp.]|nr:hypothetical protein [Thiogranum sp.]
MRATRKLLLIYSDQCPAAPGPALDIARLSEVLRERGAEVEEVNLNIPPDTLLEKLEGGAMPVVFRVDAKP